MTDKQLAEKHTNGEDSPIAAKFYTDALLKAASEDTTVFIPNVMRSYAKVCCLSALREQREEILRECYEFVRDNGAPNAAEKLRSHHERKSE